MPDMELDMLKQLDPELYDCLYREEKRQEDQLEMIASESIQPSIARALAGSIFNNKTAVGLPTSNALRAQCT